MSSRRWTKRTRRSLQRRVALAGIWMIGRLPFALAFWLGGWAGRAAFFLCRRERARTLLHLELAYGSQAAAAGLPTLDEGARLGVARDMWRNLGWSTVEAIHLQWPERLLGHTRVEMGEAEKEIIGQALAPGKGVLFITGHIGNWELLSAWFARNYPVSVVAKPLYENAYDEFISRVRRRAGARVLYVNSTDALQMIRCLHRGEGLGILIDQRMGKGDVQVPFFGRPADTAPGFAQLAMRTGASVLVGALIRTAPHVHRIALRPPLRCPDGLSRQEAALWMVRRATAELEALIREAPEQWMWMTKRWRTRRPAESDGAT